MVDFLKEEMVYLFIGAFILAIITFVSTRDFVNLNPKKVVPISAVVILALIGLHYIYRVHHIKEVTKAFKEGKNILCLDKTNKIGYVLINKGEWKLKDGEFVHPEFPRGYNIRACVEE